MHKHEVSGTDTTDKKDTEVSVSKEAVLNQEVVGNQDKNDDKAATL